MGMRKSPTPKKGRLSTNEMRNAVPIGELKRNSAKPIDKIKNVMNSNRASTDMNVPTNFPAAVSICLAGLRILDGK